MDKMKNLSADQFFFPIAGVFQNMGIDEAEPPVLHDIHPGLGTVRDHPVLIFHVFSLGDVTDDAPESPATDFPVPQQGGGEFDQAALALSGNDLPFKSFQGISRPVNLLVGATDPVGGFFVGGIMTDVGVQQFLAAVPEDLAERFIAKGEIAFRIHLLITFFDVFQNCPVSFLAVP